MIDRMQNYRIIWYGDTISGKYYQIFCQILTNSSASKNKKEPAHSGTSSSFFSKQERAEESCRKNSRICLGG